MPSTFLFAWDVLSLPEYNCSYYMQPGPQWTKQFGKSDGPFAIWSIAFGSICMLFYLPCILALWALKRSSCYKIMLFLSIVDSLAVAANGPTFGYFLWKGYVFCSAPTAVSWMAIIGNGGWYGSSVGCLILVTNRLYELTSHRHFFEGRRTDFILIVAGAYAVFGGFFTAPLLFNSTHSALFLTPWIPGMEGLEYVNKFHTFNNTIVAVAETILYIILCAVLLRMSSGPSTVAALGHSVQAQNLNRKVLIQAVLVSSLMLTTALLYEYLNMFSAPPWMTLPANVLWQLTHGAPPFIYLSLNKTMRKTLYATWVERGVPSMMTGAGLAAGTPAHRIAPQRKAPNAQ